MFSTTGLRAVALGLFAMCVAEARADAYMADFDQAQWQVQRSPLVCRLTQVVPRLGEATFEALAGGRQRFVLRAKKNPLMGGPSQLLAIAPSWNPAREPVALGTVDIEEGAEPLQLDAESAARLLDSLGSGLVPMFARPLQEDGRQVVSIGLSPINFRSAYREYNACVGQLFSVTFDDVKSTLIEFSPEQSELNTAAQRKIDFLLRYIALDHSITHFEIQGISSDGKRMLESLTLAKQRAQQVSEYLVSRGIDAKFIQTSYRADRDASSRRRFVAIRLMRNAQAN